MQARRYGRSHTFLSTIFSREMVDLMDKAKLVGHQLADGIEAVTSRSTAGIVAVKGYT